MASPRASVHEPDWRDLVREVHRRAGVDLGSYKESHVQRRLTALLARSGASGWDEYLHLLECEPSRHEELRSSMSVSFSEFFRGPAQFGRLATSILPALLAERPRLRVWSAGCAYGAEPYSIALLLRQLAPGESHYVLATDVDELGLLRARTADAFTERDVRHVPAELRRWFAPREGDGRFELAAELKSMVEFRHHDLLSGPVESDFDLIACRNVMIYFSSEAKRGLFSTLHGALRPGGYLFVGDAEVVNDLPLAGFTPGAVGFYRK